MSMQTGPEALPEAPVLTAKTAQNLQLLEETLRPDSWTVWQLT